MLEEIKHQSNGVRFLQAIAEGKLRGPLLLLGQQGVGKKMAATLAARQAFCEGTKGIDCQCSSCYQIQHGYHPDFKLIEVQKEGFGIDSLRAVVEEANDYPSSGGFQCIVIDGVDHIKDQVGDVLLKTLEEPPALSCFILLAEDSDQVLSTIKSRCGVVRFNGLPETFVLSVVTRFEDDPLKAQVYSRLGEGSAGRAVSYCVAGKISVRDQMLRAVQLSVEKDFSSAFSIVQEAGKDLEVGLQILSQIIHDVLMVRIDPMRVINLDATDALKSLASKTSASSWMTLSKKLRLLSSEMAIIPLSLTFQVKAILTETFS